MSSEHDAAPAGPDASEHALPHTRISRALDRFIDRIGGAASWLWLAIIAAIVVNVVARYALRSNIGQLDELQWHIYAVAFLIGLSYAVTSDQHIRIDMLHGGWSPKTKAWIDLIGILIFAAPFVFIVLRYGVPFVATAADWPDFQNLERSDQPSGLPYRFAIKGALVLAFALLAVAFFSRLTRATALLFGFPRPLPSDRED